MLGRAWHAALGSPRPFEDKRDGAGADWVSRFFFFLCFSDQTSRIHEWPGVLNDGKGCGVREVMVGGEGKGGEPFDVVGGGGGGGRGQRRRLTGILRQVMVLAARHVDGEGRRSWPS